MNYYIQAVLAATALLSISNTLIAQSDLIIGSTEEGERELRSFNREVENEFVLEPSGEIIPISPPIDHLRFYIEGENGDMVVDIKLGNYTDVQWKVFITNVTKNETVERGPFESSDSQQFPAIHGDVYTLQYQIKELNGDWSELSEVSAAITANRGPVVSNRRFEPASPTTFDDITFLYDIYDPDGDDFTSTVSWKGYDVVEPFPGYIGATLPSELTYGRGEYHAYILLEDELGAKGSIWFPILHQVRVQNSPPSQPIVEILPRQPDPSQDLIVNVLTYSVDPDGDEVGYDFRWFESTDGGTTWVHKAELNGSPQVSNLFIQEDELWRVEYTPYDITSRSGKRSLGRRTEGTAGRDQIFVGDNNLPELSITQAGMRGESKIDLKWSFSDEDKEQGNLNFYWSDFQGANLSPIATDIDASLGQGLFDVTIPERSQDIYLYAVVYDEKGAATQVIKGPLKQIVTSASETIWILH